MLVPVAVSLVWFSVFGGSALWQEHFGGGGLVDAVSANEASGFFALLSGFPASSLLIIVAMFSVAVFFITSSDSGTYVNGMLTSGGNPNPPLPLRISWGILEGAVAAILLFTGGAGALKSLQTASVVGGFPFMIIMFLMLYCLFKALYSEMREGTLPLEKKRIKDALEEIKAEK
jgi:glycine betaine transporter